MTRILTLLLVGAALAQDEPAPETDQEPAAEEPVEQGGPVTYALRPSGSALYVLVFNDPDRWTPVAGHDHAITATSFTGSVVWDPDDLSACKIDIRFPVTALAVDPPGMRERAGLPADGAVGDGAKKTIIGNMLGKSQLNSSQFPEIAYESTGCKASGDKVDVTGSLKVRGVSKSVTVPMTVTADGTSFSAKGSFTLQHSDFDMKPFTYGPATPKNQDKLVFHVDVAGGAS